MRFAQHRPKVLLPHITISHKVTATNSLEVGVGLALLMKGEKIETQKYHTMRIVSKCEGRVVDLCRFNV